MQHRTWGSRGEDTQCWSFILRSAKMPESSWQLQDAEVNYDKLSMIFNLEMSQSTLLGNQTTSNNQTTPGYPRHPQALFWHAVLHTAWTEASDNRIWLIKISEAEKGEYPLSIQHSHRMSQGEQWTDLTMTIKHQLVNRAAGVSSSAAMRWFRFTGIFSHPALKGQALRDVPCQRPNLQISTDLQTCGPWSACGMTELHSMALHDPVHAPTVRPGDFLGCLDGQCHRSRGWLWPLVGDNLILHNFTILSQSPFDCPGQDAMHALHRARLAPAACRTAGNGLGDWPNWQGGSSQWSASSVASGKLWRLQAAHLDAGWEARTSLVAVRCANRLWQ